MVTAIRIDGISSPIQYVCYFHTFYVCLYSVCLYIYIVYIYVCMHNNIYVYNSIYIKPVTYAYTHVIRHVIDFTFKGF